MINLDGKTFVSIENSDNGEVSGETIFHYHQNDNIVWAEYSGGSIITGHLYAIMNDDSSLNMKYHHINILNSIMSGNCTSFPKFLEDGRIRFYEQWQWTSGDNSKGTSIIEEI